MIEKKYLVFYLILALRFATMPVLGQNPVKSTSIRPGEEAALWERLRDLRDRSDDAFYFWYHYQSMMNVIEAQKPLSKAELQLLAETEPVFNDPSLPGYAAVETSYLNRGRPLVISWTSQTDWEISFLKVKLPLNWDPDRAYPLYIELHGLWDVAANPIDFMTYSFRKTPSTTYAFDDGYYVQPWGRGNQWYRGISETDIWEGLEEMKFLFRIDTTRMYLTGHSMGGYGAWYLATKKPELWAGLGIHAGALDYGSQEMLSDKNTAQLRRIPTYFVCGNEDDLYNTNLSAFFLLLLAGNENIILYTFEGGHEYRTENVERMYLWLRDFVRPEATSAPNRHQEDVGLRAEIHPNPIEKEARISIRMPRAGYAKMILSDVSGRSSTTIFEQFLPPGKSTIHWKRNHLPGGIYTCIVETEKGFWSGRLILK
ncbi:MAG TPA: alpha/beta hydrolase-fold protein [Prolixibacteraceae bacterium]|nr:alpha/beta hydrolase-fold protein [Prolixibacteraceae bacterium]